MAKQYIYHGVPEDMEGSFIRPLTSLHKLRPDLAKEYLKKYNGRQSITKRNIPLLDCLWNDVVQFLPLPPQKVFELQAELGLISKVPPYKFYKIELSRLDPKKTVVYFKDGVGEENVSVKWLDTIDLDTIQDIPKATVEYYKSLVGSGELPFNYQFVPHILYRGEVDISDCKIITLQNPTS